MFQVSNIGELSDQDIRYFLKSLREVLHTLQEKGADLATPLKNKVSNLVLLPNLSN